MNLYLKTFNPVVQNHRFEVTMKWSDHWPIKDTEHITVMTIMNNGDNTGYLSKTNRKQ